MRVDQQTTQNEDKIHGAAMQICFFAPEAPFSQNRSTILQNLMVFQKITKSMSAIVICIAPRGHKT